jgi:hypothetical protein
MRTLLALWFALCGAAGVYGQTADEIMAKVAENQDRAEAARTGYVYHQKLLVRMKRANGRLAREEDRDYTVTPAANGTTRELVKFAGKYGVGKKEVPISTPGEEYKRMDIDAGLVNSMAEHFGNDRKSRDGVSTGMFPLTASKQKHYEFSLEGKEQYRDREVFRVTFQPRKKVAREDEDEEEECWAGEALIDREEFQPVVITTHLAMGIPVAVKVILGTNIQHMGFKVTYNKVDGKLWFPVSYGGELKVRALFLYARTISMGAINSDFRKTDVQSSVTFEK